MIPIIRNPEILGPNPDQFFLDDKGRDVPLVIEHATGEPRFAAVGGLLVPYAEWAAARSRPANGQPRGITLQSADGSFSGGVSVN